MSYADQDAWAAAALAALCVARPGAMAAAVLAAVLVLWIIARGLTGDLGARAQASPGPASTFPLRTAANFDGGAVPAYYVTADGGRTAQVRATATGAVLATIRPPTQAAGFFEYVSGAASDRTFVLAAVRRLQTELYLLRLNPRARTATLSALPFTVATGSASLQLAGLALSPDGHKLAVAVNNWAPDRRRGPRVVVYDLENGSRRDWVWPGFGLMTSAAAKGQASLSWTANDKTLAFDITSSTGATATVRLLDTTAPGTDLRRSRVVTSVHNADGIETPLITADGSAILLGKNQLAASQRGATPETLSIDEYSAVTGQPLATSYEQHYLVPASDSGNPGPPPGALWANPAGTVLIISTGAEVAQQGPAIGVLRHGTFTLLQSQGYLTTGTVAW